MTTFPFMKSVTRFIALELANLLLHRRTVEYPLFAYQPPLSVLLGVVDTAQTRSALDPFRRFEHRPVPADNAPPPNQCCVSQQSSIQRSHPHIAFRRSRDFPAAGEPRRTTNPDGRITLAMTQSDAGLNRHPAFCLPSINSSRSNKGRADFLAEARQSVGTVESPLPPALGNCRKP